MERNDSLYKLYIKKEEKRVRRGDGPDSLDIFILYGKVRNYQVNLFVNKFFSCIGMIFG